MKTPIKVTVGGTTLLVPENGSVPILDKETGYFAEFPMIAIIGGVSDVTRNNSEVSFKIAEASATIKEEDAPEWLVDGVRIEIDFVNMTIIKR